MVTILIELIMSTFIAGYKVENYPYFSNFIKGILVGLIGFLRGVVPYIFKGELMAKSDLVLYFIICPLIGLLVTIFLSFLHWVEHSYKGR